MWNDLNEKKGMKDDIVLGVDSFKENHIISVCIILCVVMAQHTVKII